MVDDRLLDAEVDDRVAVVGQDDVDEVLADVVDVALDRGQHDRALALVRRPSPCAARGRPPRSSSPRPTAARTAAASGRSRTARRRSSCPASSVSLMISSGGPLRQRLVEVGLQPVALAVDDPPLEPLEQRQRGQLLGPRLPSPTRPMTPSNSSMNSAAAGRSPRGGGRRSGRARPRAARRRSWPSAGSSPRARSPCRARPSTHSCRNTEFSTCRAAGLRPNEMFERPRVVCTSGCRRLSSRIASIVSMPSRRDLLLPGADREGQRVEEDVATRACPSSGEVVDQPLGDPRPSTRRCGPGPPRRWSARRPRRRARATSAIVSLEPRARGRRRPRS